VLNQERQVRGLWAALATTFQSHPLTIRRIKKLVELGLLSPDRCPAVPAADPIMHEADQIVTRARHAPAD
jgi:hypothetical protein